MTIADDLITEFDPEKRILHLSAKRVLRITDEERLTALCGAVQDVLERCRPGRCYLIVDLAKFSIDPKLSALYTDKILAICETYLFPGGIARYGYQITRVTIKIGSRERPESDTHLFGSKAEAFAYIHRLIRENAASGIPST